MMWVIIGGVGARFIAPVGWGEDIPHVPIYLLTCIIAPVGMGQAIHRAQCLTPNLRLHLNTVYSVGISEQRTQVTASCVSGSIYRARGGRHPACPIYLFMSIIASVKSQITSTLLYCDPPERSKDYAIRTGRTAI